MVKEIKKRQKVLEERISEKELYQLILSKLSPKVRKLAEDPTLRMDQIEEIMRGKDREIVIYDDRVGPWENECRRYGFPYKSYHS